MPDRVWSFPKQKPQWFAPSSAALAMATLSYPMVRNIPRAVRMAAVVPIALPLSRRMFAARSSFDLPSGEAVWRRIRDALVAGDARKLTWVFFRSQWRVSRYATIGLDRLGTPRVFIGVQPTAARTFHPTFVSGLVHVPRVLSETQVETWTGRRFEVVPRLAHPPSCSWERIVAVADDVSTRLAGEIPRPSNKPEHWRPMHGDFTPWNLREDHAGSLWLLDWEDAAWAPRLADMLRYSAAVRSMQHERVADLVEAINADVPGTTEELAEAGDFWARHHNFVLDRGESDAFTDGKAGDLARGRREREAFRALACLVT